MTPHRAGDKKGLRGSFIIDRRTRVGRIAVASGTNHVPTFKRLNEMVTTLNETGRADLLRALRDGELSPLAVYEAFRVNELHRLPTGETLRPLKESLEAWLENVECSKAQRAAHKTMITKLTARGQGMVADLPGRLVLVGLDCRKAKTPAQFNRVRASVLAFIRDTLKRSHRLYGEVRDVPLMKERKAPLKQPQTWKQIKAIAAKMSNEWDRSSLVGMALTGMGPKEWFIDHWEVDRDRVVIYGQKRNARRRIVPAIYPELYIGPRPAGSKQIGEARQMRRFGERLFAIAGIHTYDLRRTYANWLEAAGVPRTRRKMYMGHAGGDVTSLYERHEVAQFLDEDARRIQTYLAEASITNHITKPQLVNA